MKISFPRSKFKSSFTILLGAILSIAALAVLAVRALPLRYQAEAEHLFLQRQRQAFLPEFAGDLEALSQAPRYVLKARIDPQNAWLDGQLTVTFTNTGQEPLPELVFRLYPNAGSIYGGGSLKVERIFQGKTELQSGLSEAETLLRVSLNRPLPPGQQVSVDLVFSAQAPVFPGKGYGIFSRSDHVLSLAGWYPVLASFDQDWQTPQIPRVGDALQADISLYEVELAVPSGYQVVSTGTVLATEMLSATESALEETQLPIMTPTVQSSLQSSGVPNRPITNLQSPLTKWSIVTGPAREFTLAISQDFQMLETQVGGITLRTYTLPAEDPNTPPEKSLELLTGAFQAFLDRLGPYPYAEFDLVETPITIGGYEFSGIIYVDDESRLRGGPSGYEYLLAHEVAHQWWYGLVGNPTVGEPWLDEAHATYSAVIYLQHAGRPEAAQALLSGWRKELDSAPVEDLPVGSPAPDFSDWGLYRKAVYTRGALFLDDLRESMGDEKFFELLSRFQETYRYRRATTRDYLRMAEEVAGKNLTSLYQEYFGEHMLPISRPGAAPHIDSSSIINEADILGDELQIFIRQTSTAPGS